MADLIDRDLLIPIIENNPDCDGCCDIDCATCIVDNIIKRMPTVGAESVHHGWWIPISDKKFDCCYTCSQCGFFRDAYFLDVADFCPNCGAKMVCKYEMEDKDR